MLARLLAFSAALATVAGCDKAESDNTTPTDVAQEEVAAAVDTNVSEDDVSSADAADAAAVDATPTPDTAGPTLTAEEVTAAGPHGVSWRTVTYVDTKRPTPANGDYLGAPDLALLTDVYYPSDEGSMEAPHLDGAPKAGPWPLVIYSHGYMSGRNENIPLYAYLASHGIVVAAPNFPLSNRSAEGGPTLADVAHQPGDVSFLIDSLVADSAADGWFKGQLGTPLKVAAAGLSLGGMTTGLVSLYGDMRDKRLMAFAIMAGPLCLFPPDAYPEDAPPGLLAYGSVDRIAPYTENGRKAFDSLKGDRRLVTITGGTHIGFASLAAQFLGSLEDPDTIGCTSLNENLGGKKLSDIASQVGFGGDQTDAALCPEPCTNTGEVETINVTEQGELIVLTVGAFLRAQLNDDASLLSYLDGKLGADRPKVTVEHAF